MPNAESSVDARLERMENAIHELDERLAAVEGKRIAATIAPDETSDAGERDARPPFSIALLGRSVLILGGAFVLRALTESHTLPPLAGVAGGLIYAAFWIWFADRREEATFDCATAAVIAYPLLWETATQFKLIDATLATLLVFVISLLLLTVAARKAIVAIGWIATIAGAVTFVALAIGTGATLAPMLGATCLAAVAVHIAAHRGWTFVAWPAIASSDVLAFAILGGALFQNRKSLAVAALLLYATIWLIAISARCLREREEPTLVEIAQVVESVLVAFAGGTMIAGRTVAVPALAIGLILLALMFVATRRGLPVLRATCSGLGAFGAAVGTLLLLDRTAAAILWAVVGVAAAELARRRAWMLMTMHSVAWTIAATLINGALLALHPATYVLAVLALIAYVRVRERAARIALLSVGVASVLSIAIAGIGSTPLLRTAILASSAALLAAVAQLTRTREPAILARAVLVIGGIKLLAEDLRGSAAMVVGALLMFGIATVIIARFDGSAETANRRP